MLSKEIDYNGKTLHYSSMKHIDIKKNNVYSVIVLLVTKIMHDSIQFCWSVRVVHWIKTSFQDVSP